MPFSVQNHFEVIRCTFQNPVTRKWVAVEACRAKLTKIGTRGRSGKIGCLLTF